MTPALQSTFHGALATTLALACVGCALATAVAVAIDYVRKRHARRK